MKIFLLLFSLLIGFHTTAVEACEGYCNFYTCDWDPSCFDCEFCIDPPPVCDSYCSKYMCGYGAMTEAIFLCGGCDFCQPPAGEVCDEDCFKQASEPPTEIKTWQDIFPKNCNTPEHCGGCAACTTCETWCNGYMCGSVPGCAGCPFCQKEYEPKEDCPLFCSQYDIQNPFCTGCDFIQEYPKRCDSWCSAKSCNNVECEDCPFCDSGKPTVEFCDTYCSEITCGFGSEFSDQSEYLVGPCDDCPICEKSSPPIRGSEPSKKSAKKSGSKKSGSKKSGSKKSGSKKSGKRN